MLTYLGFSLSHFQLSQLTNGILPFHLYQSDIALIFMSQSYF